MSAERWKKTERAATSMSMPPAGILTRRVTRQADTLERMEDIWVDERTSSRLLTRSFQYPKDIETTVDIQAVAEDDKGKLEEGLRPMGAADASLF